MQEAQLFEALSLQISTPIVRLPCCLLRGASLSRQDHHRCLCDFKRAEPLKTGIGPLYPHRIDGPMDGFIDHQGKVGPCEEAWSFGESGFAPVAIAGKQGFIGLTGRPHSNPTSMGLGGPISRRLGPAPGKKPTHTPVTGRGHQRQCVSGPSDKFLQIR